jgi:hypothetical protein
MTELRNLNIVSPVNPEGFVQVDVEDYNDKLIDNYFLREDASGTVLVQPTASGQYPASFNYNIVVTNGVFTSPVPAILEEVALIDISADVFFHAVVTAIAVNTPVAGQDTLTLSRPVDHPFPVASLAKRVTSNMAVNGSVTPQTFVVAGGVADAHINRIIVQMQCSAQPYINKFGDIPAISNGVLLRAWDSVENYTIFNWQSNADIANACYDIRFAPANASPSTEYGVTARITFNAKDKHGSTVEVGTGEQLQCIVRDDLLSASGGAQITSFRIMAQGHFHTHNP